MKDANVAMMPVLLDLVRFYVSTFATHICASGCRDRKLKSPKEGCQFLRGYPL